MYDEMVDVDALLEQVQVTIDTPSGNSEANGGHCSKWPT